MAINDKTFDTVVNIIIRLVFLFLLVAWCFQILTPFVNPVIWALLLAVVLDGVYSGLANKLGGRKKLSATIITLILLAVVIIPSYMFFESIIGGIKDIGTAMESGTLKVPPPTDQVKDWPLIGEKTYNAWLLASQNLEGAIDTYSEQISSLGSKLLSSIAGLAGGIFQFILASIIAGILMASSESGANFAKKLFIKIVGERGEEFLDISTLTIRNVAKGILGVALIQAFFFGVGLMLAGVPYAGLWALVVMILAIVQLPPTFVSVPVIIYLFSVDSALAATLWTIYFVVIGASDNFLKPILLGKGAPVPMLVIFLGAIGGFIATGFVGLFIGAIVLSLGYKLFETWLDEDKVNKVNEVTESMEES
jgi:predicted PurR-regulated permease PerM